MSKTDQTTVIVQTPLKRGGRLVPPNTRLALPSDEADLLLAVRAVCLPVPDTQKSVANDPAGAAPGAAGEAGETVSNPDDAGGPGAQPSAEGLVNVNTSTAEQIAEAAKGIGINTARDVVKWRKASGPFVSLDELAKVGGIGKATVKRNRGVLTV